MRARSLALFSLVALLGGLALVAAPGPGPVRPAPARASTLHGGGAARPAVRAAAAPSTDVSVVNFNYGPQTLTIDPGTTVTWHNTSNRAHTATDRGGTFDTKPILPGASTAVTFSTPGTYFYFCQVNPAKMNGVIVVRPSSNQAKAIRVQAVDGTGFVQNEHFRFDPNHLTVTTGTTLLVANVGGKPHTLTADDGSFDTGVITPGAEGGRFAGHSATVTLTKPGTFAFHCDIHPALMKGTITVLGTASNAPPPQVSTAPRQVPVSGKDFAFDPNDASVAPGGTVLFQNKGKAPHTITFDDQVNGATLDTGQVQPGASAKLTAPTQPGSYSYHCSVHPAKMHGVLVVLGQGVEDPTKTAVATATPAATVTTGGPGSGLTVFVLATAVLAAFAGGFGLSAFMLRRRRAT